MNKFELINKVLISDLAAEDKCLLIELIMRMDDEGVSWPSVERLCKVRGIKYEKNFKGVDNYLPGLVTKKKRGRKNTYTINTPALAGVSEAEVVLRHTPALEGVSSTTETNTPAVEGANTPAVADNTPAVEGANSTKNNKEDSSLRPVSDGPVEKDSLNIKEEEVTKEVRGSIFLNSLEKREIHRWCLGYRLNEEEITDAVGVSKHQGMSFDDSLRLHLEKEGVNMDEWE